MKLTIYGGNRETFIEDNAESKDNLVIWHFEDHPQIEVDKFQRFIFDAEKSGDSELKIWTSVELLIDKVRVMVKHGAIAKEDVRVVWYDYYGKLKHELGIDKKGYVSSNRGDYGDSYANVYLELIVD